MIAAWLMAFVLINGQWHFGPTLKGWEATLVGDPRLCADASHILNTYNFPYTDYYGRKVDKIYAFCVVPQ
jgi:hypothetical protein